ncbi:hypothetical protein [Actinoplanes rectilineatus]|uniref:hypothetical protein n=1 Tax=Actinoplanes rectilineatus TaxID=113571 RepID=UPI000B147FE9|nr:hypothetical protein [Actinoplanes rectilineatus]
MSRNQIAVFRSEATGETYRVARQRIAAAQLSVVSFLRDDDYADPDTLPFIRPIATALGRAGRRVLIITDDGITARLAFDPSGRRRLPVCSIIRLALNVDLLMIPVDVDFDEFQTREVVLRQRDSGGYTHLLIDAGGENALSPLYQVGWPCPTSRSCA